MCDEERIFTPIAAWRMLLTLVVRRTFLQRAHPTELTIGKHIVETHIIEMCGKLALENRVRLAACVVASTRPATVC